MSARRKPLDDAKRRVNEKLNAIEEQTEFIQQSVSQLITGVRKTAQHLLGETSKTKFFNKYRAVSQELEKCLDDLLLISATISSLDDNDEEEDEESEEDEDGKHVEEEPRKIQEVVPERNGSCTTERITPSSSLQEPLIVVLEVKEEVVPELRGKVVADLKEKVVPDLRDEVVPCLKDEVVPELKDEVVPDLKDKVVPELKEKVVPDLEDEVVPCLKDEVVPDLKDEVVPELKEKVVPDLRDEVVPCLKDEVVPDLKAEVVPEFKEKLIPELKEEVAPTKLVELQLPAVVTQASEAVPIKSKATTVAVDEDLFAGDLIEEVLKDESHEFNDKPMKEKGLQIPPFKFPEIFSLEVIVTEITSPCEFWIQQMNGDLDLLMEEMCFFFSKRAKAGDKGGMNKSPSVGDVCCAKSTQDEIWYRALVTAVSGEKDAVEVLYVDEGNGEGLPLSRLRPLEEKFRKLPFQALCCELSGVKLNRETKLKEVKDWFKRRVAGEALEAALAEKGTAGKATPSFSPGAAVPIDLYIRPPGTSATTRVDSLKLEYNLHEMMIREGFSRRGLSPEETRSVSPASSHSDVRSMTKTESMRSTSTTSGFHEDPSCTGDVYPQSKPRDVTSRGYLVGALIPHRVPPPVIPVDSDGSLYMLVSHVCDPGEFYVHFITSEAGKLDTLMEEMKKTYEESDLRDNCSHADHFSPRVGDFCCAKFSGDGNWYRAVVLQARSSLNKSDGVDGSGERKTIINVEVFYIDFGNIESLGVENLRDLLPRFMELPAQVVRCSLADVEPLAKCTAGPDEVFVDTPANTSVFPDAIQHDSISHPPSAPRRSPRSRSHRKKPRRNRPHPSAYDNTIAIAAGDEDPDDDLLDTFFLAKAPRPKTPTRSSISEDIDKSHRTPSLLLDTAVELFQTVWSKDSSMVSSSWSFEATEVFKRLTEDAQKLVGFLVPWDSQMMNNIVNYCQGSECSLPNLGPVLRLNLYDVSGNEDIFINGAMVKGKYATSSTIIQEEETTKPDMDVKECEQVSSEVSSHPVSPSSSADSSQPSSPKSPTLNLLKAWNPMSHDYQSSRNAYSVKTDNLDVAITGYDEDRGKICPFYRSKYGCFQGSKCPNEHVQQDLTGHVCIYGARSYMSIVLPEIGAWVAVRVSAIYDPTHFWVQLPFGREPIDSQIIKSRSGKETSGEENLKDLDDLMKRMSEFYSKTFRRERSLAPVTDGELVVLRYKKDKRWYRGKVCLERGDKYQVCFVDYGFSDWINKNDVCPMVPHFLHLPFQAVECFLANIEPTCDVPEKDTHFMWSKDSKRRFESLTEDKVLVCQILSTGSNETMFVNLFDTAGDSEVNISQVMIDSGFAKETDFKISQPLNFSSPLDTDSRTVLKLPG